nr:BTB/POZ and MATH domain-containing protein 1-like [Aegilops tauschii subsp. strangulata]
MDGADVTFLVRGDKFSAHRLVLAARSPVFKAELFGSMKEKDDNLVEIHEMEAHVFKCLLYFIYTDTLPALEMGSLDVTMASHLLVAADRYNIERLKLSKHKLCNHIHADDCFSIMCDLTIIKNNNNTLHQETMVPPSDLHRHLGNLLESMDGADVTFLVGEDKFLAHRVVLAARSSVFKAELLGAMKEKANNLVEIKEMESDVFRCLLRFIYTDLLPDLQNMPSNQGEARRDVVMASHLLVAADRYNVERLKLICEHNLCSNIDTNMVATSLALAEQHSCKRLREACLRFLASPSNLEATMASDSYEHLKRSCPSALKELIASLLPDTMKAAKDIIMEI